MPSLGKLAPKPKPPLWRTILLLAVPASIALRYFHASPVLVFVTACLAVLPLAGLMGEATEHIAARTGPTIGGLLNATFGNAAELIIAIMGLRAAAEALTTAPEKVGTFVSVVKASITGSIIDPEETRRRVEDAGEGGDDGDHAERRDHAAAAAELVGKPAEGDRRGDAAEFETSRSTSRLLRATRPSSRAGTSGPSRACCSA